MKPNCKFINVLMFAAGAAVGSAVTWKILKTKYDQIVQEEIASIKEAFADMPTEIKQADEYPDEEEEIEQEDAPHQINWDELEDLDPDELEEAEADYAAREYKKIVGNYSNEEGGAEKVGSEPRTISPYDFGELDDYRTIELTCYADGTVEDDEYNIVSEADVNKLIGADSLKMFGEYEDDAVFVRNDWLRTDFQILRDPRTYEEARSIGPGKVDDE